jgi:hypothetical protein
MKTLDREVTQLALFIRAGQNLRAGVIFNKEPVKQIV